MNLKTTYMLILFLLLTGIFLNRKDVQDISERQLSEIKQYVIPVAVNDSILNLTFLDSILQGKDIVFLGEKIHTDEHTFEVKRQIVEFLHQKMGFDVVLYEAALYDMWRMEQKSRQAGRDTLHYPYETGLGLYRFWLDNEPCRKLLNYYASTLQTDRPIALGGFDIQRTGLIHRDERLADATNYLSKRGIRLEDYPALWRYRQYLANQYVWELPSVYGNTLRYDSVMTDFDRLVERLAEINRTATCVNREDEMFYRYLNGWKTHNRLLLEYDVGAIPRMQVRDSLMADNLIWQIDSIYPNRKIVVWLANTHAMLEPTFKDSYTPMAQYIKRKYNERTYVMPIASYGKKNKKSNRFYDTAGRQSIEYLIHKAGYEFAFVDFKRSGDSPLLNGEYISTMDQGVNFRKKWSQAMDGFFYLDKQQ